jgi:hypothetical protein
MVVPCVKPVRLLDGCLTRFPFRRHQIDGDGLVKLTFDTMAKNMDVYFSRSQFHVVMGQEILIFRWVLIPTVPFRGILNTPPHVIQRPSGPGGLFYRDEGTALSKTQPRVIHPYEILPMTYCL